MRRLVTIALTLMASSSAKLFGRPAALKVVRDHDRRVGAGGVEGAASGAFCCPLSLNP